MRELDTAGRPALAVAMWDFSWLERRWTGGGYEDWGAALDELVERGYDAVRIDAYPHLLAYDGSAEFTLVPTWTQHEWGSPRRLPVRPYPALIEFMALARDRGLRVALSTWFREDAADTRMRIGTPEQLGQVWCATLDLVAEAGLLDAVWYVDLCNEWPQSGWCPFVYGPDWKGRPDIRLASERGRRWTNGALAVVRERYPRLPLCFSTATQFEELYQQDYSGFDLLEPHIWLVNGAKRKFYDEVGFRHKPEDNGFDPAEYDLLAERAEPLYRSGIDEWHGELIDQIDRFAGWSRQTGIPLVTTECWASVIWKDGPGLDWGWVKDVCELGVAEAVRHGTWKGIATSNFCGPQFRGMWTDVAWHRRLTSLIHGRL